MYILSTYIFIVIVNECPVPEDIPIGSVKYASLTYASIAVYSCPSNYIISGYQQRQCQADKTWTGSPPTCVPKNQCKYCNQLCFIIIHIHIRSVYV